jgi:hypothetical protein
MMPDKKRVAIQTRFAERLREFKADFIPKVAELNRPVLGNETVSKDERRRRWWQEEDGWTPEQERMLLTATYPDGSPILNPQTGTPMQPLTREDVGLLRFPHREIDALASSGPNDDRAIAKYAAEMTALGPPEPDLLEQAAMAVRPPEPAPLTTPAAQPMQPDALPVPEMGGLY